MNSPKESVTLHEVNIVYPEPRWDQATIEVPEPSEEDLKQGIINAQITVPVEKVVMKVSMPAGISEEELFEIIDNMRHDECEQCGGSMFVGEKKCPDPIHK